MRDVPLPYSACTGPSMKVPPKRKGNPDDEGLVPLRCFPSMKVPPKRKGNLLASKSRALVLMTLNESPSEKEGKYASTDTVTGSPGPSMKVPPKRKGNLMRERPLASLMTSLNESPSEKEGKFLLAAPQCDQTSTLNESPSEKEGKSARIFSEAHRYFSPQ